MPEPETQPAAADNTARSLFRRRRQLERDLEHVTKEIYKKNYELAETNKTLSLLRAIYSIALTSDQSLQAVCNQIASAITEVNDYAFVGIFTSVLRNQRELLLQGWSSKGGTSERPARLNYPLYLKLNHPWMTESEQSRLISVAQIKLSDAEPLLGCTLTELRSLKQQLPAKSLYVVKLMGRNRLVGAIVVGFADSLGAVSDNATLLIDRLSEGVGVAVDSKLLYEENRLVLKQLQRSNAKLRQLDETKDDFISMASHQLRTPLTSVKGYLSMVLEGDAGPLTSNQRKLLEQSYRSSQQMVYLISDLLNLSRLNTGKFVIEPSAVDLSEIVQFEVGQLAETAKARNITLEYDRPASFPRLQLDETKTHQVIMNFIDNAIYYTPAGGTVTISLKETPDHIEYRVKDTGIGVPKAAQRKLFSKFFRADNAQKARPDGTGLGLFMAKKVVAAQGGAIIFESEEGKGSTFGFRFNKERRTPAKA